MGGEGSDDSKRKTQKMMTEFNLLQRVATKEIQKQQPQGQRAQPGRPATGQSKREKELEQYITAFQKQAQGDVYQLMSIIQQLGGFNQKNLIPFYKGIKKRYNI